MAGERWRLGHRPGLDGLRGLAILLVIAAHTGKDLGYRSGGTAGVTLFFVLSGFLITSLLLEEHEKTGAVSLGAFYARRARRLLPALGVLLVAVAGAYLVIGRFPLSRMWPVVLYVANWHRAEGHYVPLLNHTWSLAIEEQFYIVWPLVLIVGLRFGRRFVLRLALAGAVASIALRFVLADGAGREDRVWFGTDTNAFALLAGCALALWMSGRIVRANRPRLALGVAALLVVAGAYSSNVGFTLVVPLLTAATGVVLIVLLCQAGPVGVFGSSALRYVGRRSYAYYLWHAPLLVGLGIYFQPAAAAVLMIVATAVLGELSWRLVERPLLQRKRAQAKGWIAAPSHQPLAVQSIG